MSEKKIVKSWIIEMIEEEGKTIFRRKNNGFNPYELLGICEDIKNDILMQLNKKNAGIEKELIYPSGDKAVIKPKLPELHE